MQAPGGPQEDTSGGFKYGGWTSPFFDEFAGKEMDSQMKEPFSLLLGRRTYDIFAGYWPEHEEMWPGVNRTTKYVVTHKKLKPTWENTEVINKNIVADIKKIKTGKGPDMQVYGSSVLVQTLLKNELVDELWLKIFPVTLGEGKKLFDSGTIAANWELTQTSVSPAGVIFANYRRLGGKVKTGTM
jgi:dihydrofolate reductase